MKKALSILISVMMVAGLFVALVPTASAATVLPADAPAMPETGLLVYNEDFEGENLVGKTDVDLTRALGWVSAADIPDDPETTYDDAYATEGLLGSGYSALVVDEETGNTGIQMKFDKGGTYGWSTKIVDNERLAGANYIIEYTMTIDAVANTSGFGLTIRNNSPWNASEAGSAGLTGFDTSNVTCYASHIKRTCQFDMHYKAVGLGGAKTGYDVGSYEGQLSGSAIAGMPGVNYLYSETKEYDPTCANKYTLMGCTNTYRTVVSVENGLQNYVYNADADEWVYLFGMDETSRDLFATSAQYIGSGINFVVRNGVTMTWDDLAVYTIADAENDPTVEMLGYQTAANGSNLDARFVAKVANLAETDVVAQVRYEICINDEFWSDVWLENAYKEITASYGAEAITAEADELLTALHVTGCPAGTTFSVTPYVTFADGAQLVGDTFDCTISA